MALENRQLCPLGEREGGHSGRCEGSKWLGPLPSENLEVSLLGVPLCSHLQTLFVSVPDSPVTEGEHHKHPGS